MFASKIASVSPYAAMARSMLSSRSRCKVGKGERLLALPGSSTSVPANW